MDPRCEFCRAEQAVVYCRPDEARLCLPCDAHVHSANAFARRHVRALLCDRCLSAPAVVCRPSDSISLCETCDCATPGLGCRLHIGRYTGCPSLWELAWACAPLIDVPAAREDGLMTIHEDVASCCWEAREGMMRGGMEPCSVFNPWIRASSSLMLPPIVGGELLGCFHNYKELIPHKASSSVHDWATLQSSQVVGQARAMQAANENNDEVILNLSDRRNSKLLTAHFPLNISVSVLNHTVESSAANYQDCGVSLMLRTAEAQWDSNLENFSLARDKAKLRYNENRKSRSFGKNIKYVTRKTRADTRKRMKGRFVKAGQDFDSDPLLGRST